MEYRHVGLRGRSHAFATDGLRRDRHAVSPARSPAGSDARRLPARTVPLSMFLEHVEILGAQQKSIATNPHLRLDGSTIDQGRVKARAIINRMIRAANDAGTTTSQEVAAA
jgi:uncharacterized protein (DUF924 family)